VRMAAIRDMRRAASGHPAEAGLGRPGDPVGAGQVAASSAARPVARHAWVRVSIFGLRRQTCGFALTGWLSSADSSVLLDQASEDMMTLDLADRKRDDAGLIKGCAKVQGPVRPAAVVMAGVLGQDCP
jgi:hypothetical protein